jgi:hypothetical protein
MLTLCLPAAGIQEVEAVAIGTERGGLWWEEGRTGRISHATATVICEIMIQHLVVSRRWAFFQSPATACCRARTCAPLAIYVLEAVGGTGAL